MALFFYISLSCWPLRLCRFVMAFTYRLLRRLLKRREIEWSLNITVSCERAAPT